MTFYEIGKVSRWVFLFVYVAILAAFLSFLWFAFYRVGMSLNPVYVLFSIFYFLAIPMGRGALCAYVIDEKGVTSKLLGRNIFIAWDEMEFIGVGDQWVDSSRYSYLLCFSKTTLEKTYFKRSFLKPWERPKQNKQHFFIPYREGMLKEVLKHIPESRIKDVERIKNCPEPHKLQSRSKMRGERMEPDLRSTVYRIDDIGVSYDLPTGRSVTMSWGEAAHIGIAEVRPTAFDYLYCIYFSKIPLKKTYFHDHEERKLTPSNEQVFIPYRESLLDEVLQYVNKSKIHKIERILNCPNPHEMQKSEKPRVLEMD